MFTINFMETERLYVLVRQPSGWYFISTNAPPQNRYLPLERWHTATGRTLVFARACYTKEGAEKSAKKLGMMEGPDLYYVFEGERIVATVWMPSTVEGTIEVSIHGVQYDLLTDKTSTERIKEKLRSALGVLDETTELNAKNQPFADFVLGGHEFEKDLCAHGRHRKH